MDSTTPRENETGKQPGPDTSAVVRGARENVTGSFEDLYRRLAPAVYAWARLRIPDDGSPGFEPADVVQETWLAAWRRFADFDPARASFRAWLFGVANRTLLAQLRRGARTRAEPHRARQPGSPSDPPAEGLSGVEAEATNVSRAVARDEALARLVTSLAALDPEEREVFVHLGLEGLSARVAAPIIGATQAAIEKRWQRLRAKLRTSPEALLLVETTSDD